MKEICINVDEYNRDSINTIQGNNNAEVYKIYVLFNKRRLDLTGKTVKMAYLRTGTVEGDVIALNVTNATEGEITLQITNAISKRDGVYSCQLAIYGADGFLEHTATFGLTVEANIFNQIANEIADNKDLTYIENILEQAKTVSGELKTNIPIATNLNNSLESNTSNASNINSTLADTTEKSKVAATEAIQKKSELESSIVEAKKFIDGLDGSQNIPQIRLDVTELQNRLKSNQALIYEGSNITAENTLEGRTAGMRIKGRTLLNIHKKQQYSFATNLNNENYIVSKGENSCEVTLKVYEPGKYCFMSAGLIQFNLLEPNTKYTIIAEATDGLFPEFRTPSYTYPLNKSSTPFKNGVATITTNDLSDGDKGQVLYIPYNTELLNVKQYIRNVMIIKDEVNFTSGYFEDIKSFGELEYNLFNKTLSDFQNGIQTGDAKLVYFNLKPNTKYTCSSNVPKSNSLSMIYFNAATTDAGGVWAGNSKTVTTGNDGSLYIGIRNQNYQDDKKMEDFFNGKYYIMLQEGTTATEYIEPGKYNIATLSHNENLFTRDINFKFPANTSIYSEDYANKMPKGTYYISGWSNNTLLNCGNIAVIFKDKNKAQIDWVAFSGIRALVLNKDVEYITLFSNGVEIKDIYIDGLMISEKKHTSYQQYKSDKKNIFIQEPLRGFDENTCDLIYEDNGQVIVNRNIAKTILNNNSGWKDAESDGTYTKMSIANFPNMKYGCRVTCDKLPQKQDSPGVNNQCEYIATTGDKYFSFVVCLKVPNYTEFLKRMEQNPLEVYYQLSTPVTEVVENCVDIDLDTFQDKTYFNILNSLPGSLDFKVPSNIGSIVQSNSKAINELYDLINKLIIPGLIDVNKTVAMATIKNNLQ